MTKKQINAAIDRKLLEITVNAAADIEHKIDALLTDGIVDAINRRIKEVMQENYVITMTVGLKKR